MDLDLTGFSPAQQHALFELLVLAMYADGHLSAAENGQLHNLLVAMGLTEESARLRKFDAAVTRLRPLIPSLHKAKEEALSLASVFTDRSQQQRVYTAVEQIMTGDNHVSSWESTLLSELRLKFRV